MALESGGPAADMPREIGIVAGLSSPVLRESAYAPASSPTATEISLRIISQIIDSALIGKSLSAILKLIRQCR